MAHQCFITTLIKKIGNIIHINDDRIIQQCRRVLRYSVGDCFTIQTKNIRYYVEIISYKGDHILTRCIQTSYAPDIQKTVTLCVASLNKREKMELIVQKACEIGVKSILFFPSHRSVIKEGNQKKIIRMQEIAREACEQSRNWFIPNISRSDKPLGSGEIFVADFDGCRLLDRKISSSSTLIIGPEGGRTSDDYLHFPPGYIICSLGSSVLKAETAAIIGSRILVNN